MSNTLQQLSNEMADLVEGAAEGVLRVDARRRIPASGVAWAEDLVVTAHHVVERDDDISIGLPDGSRLSAELVGRDPRHDLALLKTDAALQSVKRAEAELRAGNIVLALGRPRMRVKASLGIVSGIINPAHSRTGRRAAKGGRQGKAGWQKRAWLKKAARKTGGWEGMLAGSLIQTDLTMYAGFSGGPLLGVDGAVYGMNTSGFAGGISAAIPLAVMAKSVAALLADGKIQSAYLGIGVQSALLPEAMAESLGQAAGLLIVSVEPDSPATAAGLLVGDILTVLQDEPMENVDELQLLLARLEAGSAIDSSFVRGGELREGSVVVGAR